MKSTNDSSASLFLSSRGYDKIDSNKYYLRDFFFDHMIWAQLLSGGNAIRKRMALALSEIFVVSVTDLDIIWPAHAVGSYWDMLNQHAFGNFRDLLEAVTLSPAMGVFLDTLGNQKADPTTGRVPDENYAREVMQLFTIGLHELKPDGTPQLSGGNPIETYDNNDVIGLAKVFTGYDLDYSNVSFNANPTGSARQVPDAQVVRQPMTADPTRWYPARQNSTHSLDEKRFLGTVIPAGTGPAQSLRIALDALFGHPNVGPFISKQLIQRLVTSNPSPAYVGRVAHTFAENGNGVRGDLRAVFKAIITDPEATDVSGTTDPRFGKLREPILRFAQWGQTFSARSDSTSWQIRNLARPGLLNQAPLRSPSVFNFFRPEYVPPRSQAAANELVAPEFQIADESSVAGYVNFMRGTIEGRNFWTDDIRSEYSKELKLAADPQELLDHLDLVLTAGQLNQTTRDLILAALKDVAIDGPENEEAKLRRIQLGIMLTMCSNDYLVQK